MPVSRTLSIHFVCGVCAMQSGRARFSRRPRATAHSAVSLSLHCRPLRLRCAVQPRQGRQAARYGNAISLQLGGRFTHTLSVGIPCAVALSMMHILAGYRVQTHFHQANANHPVLARLRALQVFTAALARYETIVLPPHARSPRLGSFNS